ncbi:MAG: iron-containing alcohol dehydrogenase, partial [Chloroflexota bacterium]|nr:iron-containing alcohol dehydrogenase [Chloroflexota bacterium]
MSDVGREAGDTMGGDVIGRFWTPTEIVFGPGVAGTLAEHVDRLGARRVWLVTDPGVRAAGIVDRVAGPLAALAGVEVPIWDDVHPNPRDVECEAGAAAARDAGADLVVAVGGGSPLDAGKAMAALATNGGTVAGWAAPRTMDQPPLPLIA